jgi:hypothetical protein
MTSTLKIILLGVNCRIVESINNLKLKHETNLFDWFASDDFNDVIDIINHVYLNCDIDIKIDNDKTGQLSGYDIYLNNTKIHTCHYTPLEIIPILKRRAKRFLYDLNNTSPILFIRDEPHENISIEYIEKFNNLIKKINPSLDYKLLLLTPNGTYSELIAPRVVHKIFNDNDLLNYINEARENHELLYSTHKSHDKDDNDS